MSKQFDQVYNVRYHVNSIHMKINRMKRIQFTSQIE
jgi:hypothetical protein